MHCLFHSPQKSKRDLEEKRVIREGSNSLITYSNASAFSVFSHVRHFVLQNQLCSTFNSRIVPGKAETSDSGSEDEGEEDAGKKEDIRKMPVMVGLGVKGVFVIIGEIRYSHPELCLQALTEFSNILCEQTPAALKNEPKETTGEYYGRGREERQFVGGEVLCVCVCGGVRGDNGKCVWEEETTSG